MPYAAGPGAEKFPWFALLLNMELWTIIAGMAQPQRCAKPLASKTGILGVLIGNTSVAALDN